MILILLAGAVPQSAATQDQRDHPVHLYMYTESGNDILKLDAPTSDTDTTKDCPDQNQQNTVTVISTWEFNIKGDVRMDGESIDFYVWAQHGNGHIGTSTTTTNKITILFELMKNSDVIVSNNDTHVVQDDPVKFEIDTDAASFSMASGDTLGFRLSYSWQDEDGQLPIAAPNDLQLVYASTSHDSNGQIPCDYVNYISTDSSVDTNNKKVDVTATVNDAFGTDDLKDYAIDIEKNDHSYSAHASYISGPDPTVNGDNVDLDWTWDYDGDGASSGDYTATITTRDQRDVEWTTTVAFTIPGQTTHNYGVDLSTPDTLKTGAPDKDITFTIRVENTGDTTDSYDIFLLHERDYTDWNPGFNPGRVSDLEAGSYRNVIFSVTVPSTGVHDGDVEHFTIRAVSSGDNSKSDDINLSVKVHIVYEVYLSTSVSTVDVSLAKEGEFQVYVQNKGNIEDSYQISTAKPTGWSVRYTAGENFVSLDPGDSTTITLAISPPEDADNGVTTTIGVTAVSTGKPEVTASVQVHAEVRFELTALMDEILKVKQGKSGDLHITITSNSPDSEKVVLTSKLDNQNTDWVKFYDESGNEIPSLFILNSHDTVTVIAKVKAPDNADVGDHQLTIYARNIEGNRISPYYTVDLTVEKKESSSADTMLYIASAGVLAVVVGGGGLLVYIKKGKKKKDEEEEEEEGEEEKEEKAEVKGKPAPPAAARPPAPRRPPPPPPGPAAGMTPGRIAPYPPRAPPVPGQRASPYPHSPRPAPAYPPRPPSVPGQRAAPYPPRYPQAPQASARRPPYPQPPVGRAQAPPGPYPPRAPPAAGAAGRRQMPGIKPVAPPTPYRPEPVSVAEVEEEGKKKRFGRKKKSEPAEAKPRKEGRRFGKRKSRGKEEEGAVVVAEEAPVVVAEEEPVVVVGEEPVVVAEEPAAVVEEEPVVVAEEEPVVVAEEEPEVAEAEEEPVAVEEEEYAVEEEPVEVAEEENGVVAEVEPEVAEVEEEPAVEEGEEYAAVEVEPEEAEAADEGEYEAVEVEEYEG